MDYNAIKERTISNANLQFIDGYWRYINYQDRIITTGFKELPQLQRNTNLFRFDEFSLPFMNDRFESYAKAKLDEAERLLKSISTSIF